jgi:hypothetical protein
MARFDIRLRIGIWYTVKDVEARTCRAAVPQATKALSKCLRVASTIGDGIPSPSDINFDWPWGADVLKLDHRHHVVGRRHFTHLDDAWVQLPQSRKKVRSVRDALAEFDRVLDRRYGKKR